MTKKYHDVQNRDYKINIFKIRRAGPRYRTRVSYTFSVLCVASSNNIVVECAWVKHMGKPIYPVKSHMCEILVYFEFFNSQKVISKSYKFHLSDRKLQNKARVLR